MFYTLTTVNIVHTALVVLVVDFSTSQIVGSTPSEYSEMVQASTDMISLY